jgi:hypothetical protein
MKVGLVVEEAEGEERLSTPSSEWSVSGGVRMYPAPG